MEEWAIGLSISHDAPTWVLNPSLKIVITCVLFAIVGILLIMFADAAAKMRDEDDA